MLLKNVDSTKTLADLSKVGFWCENVEKCSMKIKNTNPTPKSITQRNPTNISKSSVKRNNPSNIRYKPARYQSVNRL